MKSIALICVFLLLPLHYALATTEIFIDGVVDATPGQSFSAAGGAILIRVIQDNKGDGTTDTTL